MCTIARLSLSVRVTHLEIPRTHCNSRLESGFPGTLYSYLCIFVYLYLYVCFCICVYTYIIPPTHCNSRAGTGMGHSKVKPFVQSHASLLIFYFWFLFASSFSLHLANVFIIIEVIFFFLLFSI